MKIPPHIGWPLLVIAFLLAGVVSTFSVVYFAGSDGGVQVLPDYQQEDVQVPADSLPEQPN